MTNFDDLQELFDKAMALDEAQRKAFVARIREGQSQLADELARLLDQVETEGLGFDSLETLVPEEHAAHWQETIKFLEVLTTTWPAIQEAQGCIGPAERRRRDQAERARGVALVDAAPVIGQHRHGFVIAPEGGPVGVEAEARLRRDSERVRERGRACGARRATGRRGR